MRKRKRRDTEEVLNSNAFESVKEEEDDGAKRRREEDSRGVTFAVVRYTLVELKIIG